MICSWCSWWQGFSAGSERLHEAHGQQQHQEHEVEPQEVEGELRGAGQFHSRHLDLLCARAGARHDVVVADDALDAVLRIHHGEHPVVVLLEQRGEVLADRIRIGRHGRAGHDLLQHGRLGLDQELAGVHDAQQGLVLRIHHVEVGDVVVLEPGIPDQRLGLPDGGKGDHRQERAGHEVQGRHFALGEEGLNPRPALIREQFHQLPGVLVGQHREQIHELRRGEAGQDVPGPFLAQVGDDLALGPRLGLREGLGGLPGLEGGEEGFLLRAGQLLQGVGQVFLREIVQLLLGDGQLEAVGRGRILHGQGLHPLPGDEVVLDQAGQALQAPLPEPAIEGGVHGGEQPAVGGLLHQDIVHHLDVAVIDVQDGAAHQVLVRQDPARLVLEGGIAVALVRWEHRDSRLVHGLDPVPGDELGGLAPAAVEEEPHGLRQGLLQGEDDVRGPAVPAAAALDPHGLLEHAGEVEAPELWRGVHMRSHQTLPDRCSRNPGNSVETANSVDMRETKITMDQLMTFWERLLTCFPMNCSSFRIRIRKMRADGSRVTATTCTNMVIITRGAFGMSTTAPEVMSMPR